MGGGVRRRPWDIETADQTHATATATWPASWCGGAGAAALGRGAPNFSLSWAGASTDVATTVSRCGRTGQCTRGGGWRGVHQVGCGYGPAARGPVR